MSNKQIYLKTLIFVWAKLGLGLSSIILSAIWLLFCFFVGNLFEGYAILISLVIGIGGIKVIYHLINSYIGYLIKAAHIAVIVKAVQSGSIPEKQFEYGIQQVKYRFISSNIFFTIDKLIDGAVKQLQDAINKTESLLGNIPGLSIVFSFLKVFTNIALGYIDECCLGYIFLQKEKGAFRSACDGIVIYFKDWKKLLKNTVMTAVFAIATYILIVIVSYELISGAFLIFNGSQFVCIIFALLLTTAIKNSFIDSCILIRMITAYLNIAVMSDVDSSLYKKFCMISNKFKEMFMKMKEENESTYLQ